MRALFNSQTKTVTFAAILLAGSVLISRLLGLLRDRLLAGKFGAGAELDIYFAAFRIPDFVYGILIMGGITAVFLPVFSEYFKKSQEEGWQLASNVLNCFLVLLISACAVLAVLAPVLIKFIAPGFDSEQKSLAISLTRIMFLSPVLFGLSSVFSGVLHYFNRFFAYSLAPILYNLGIIFGILFLVPVLGIWGLAWGVVLGAFLHWVCQIPAAKASGFKYLPTFNFKFPGLLKIFKLMIPRTVGAAAYHINLIVITAIASTLAAGSIAVFNFSNNLQYFPIGLVGSSFAIASFPALSRAWAERDKEKFLKGFSSVFRQILFLVVPISILMFLLRAQIVRLVLGTGEFDWLATRLTAASLGLFCLGIFAFSFIPFLARVFYSFQDTKTPVAIGMGSVVLNIVLAISFVWLLGFENSFSQFVTAALKLQSIERISVVGLPLALSISGIFQFFLLLVFLRRKLGEIRLGEIWRSFWKVVVASVLMALVVYWVLQLLAGLVDMNTFKGILAQTTGVLLVGATTYFLIACVLKSPEIKTIWSSILKQFTKTS
ncbi:MAG: murein biosynthesis integral membrane protein MurJ [Candidatus Nealsonbacteria bacterium]|nr:MAG: murein biosynthesis integral membrane protein MurJ [Candidatus Nealsonbacteria bacterium]